MIVNIMRFAFGFILLGIGAYTDYKTRTAPNDLWILMGSYGVMFSMMEIQWLYMLPNLIMILLMLVLYRLKKMGGADVKAMMGIAILTPFLLMDTLLWSMIVLLISIILLYLINHKKYSLWQLGTQYPYPFLVPLWIGFIVAFLLPIL